GLPDRRVRRREAPRAGLDARTAAEGRARHVAGAATHVGPGARGGDEPRALPLAPRRVRRAVLRVGPLLGPAHAVRASRAVRYGVLPREPVRSLGDQHAGRQLRLVLLRPGPAASVSRRARPRRPRAETRARHDDARDAPADPLPERAARRAAGPRAPGGDPGADPRRRGAAPPRAAPPEEALRLADGRARPALP